MGVEMQIDIMPIMTTVIGFLIVYVLNGIKGEIKEIKGKLDKIEGDLHERINDNDRRHTTMLVDVERRLSTIEGRCKAEHP